MTTGNIFDNHWGANLDLIFCIENIISTDRQVTDLWIFFFFCSLNSLVHSSRKLTLRLLDFISKHQVIIFFSSPLISHSKLPLIQTILVNSPNSSPRIMSVSLRFKSEALLSNMTSSWRGNFRCGRVYTHQFLIGHWEFEFPWREKWNILVCETGNGPPLSLLESERQGNNLWKKFLTEVVLFHVTVISFQDASLFQESASDLNTFSPQGLGSSASVIPYPTRNLSFYNGQLGVWDGRWQKLPTWRNQ